MKELSFEKMEEIKGGGVWGCIAAGLGGTSVIVAGAMLLAGVASGPPGWIGLGLAAGAFTATVVDGDPC